MPSPDSFKLVKEFPRQSATFAVACVPESGCVFLGGLDFKVVEADLTAAKFEPKDLYSHESYVTGVALAGKTLVSGGYDGKLIWWDTTANKTIRKLDAHSKWIRRVIATPDGSRVVSVADDMACKVWDAATGKLVHDLRGHQVLTPTYFPSMLHAVTVSSDGKYLATGDKVGHVAVWDTKTGKPLGTLESSGMYTWDPVQRRHSIGGIRSLAFSPDGVQLAVGGIGKIGNVDHLEGKARVEVFDWKAGKSLIEFASDKFKGLVNHLAFAPDGAWLVGAGGANEGFILFHDVAKKKALREEKLPMHVHDFVLSPEGDTITAVGHNKIAVYELG
jgi:WD40 repeat protein